MEVLAFDKFAQDDGVARMVTLDELLAQSDVISLHCPLFPDTQGIINRESIAKMKDGVLLINTSRGPLIVEEDLAAALQSGKVAGAGLDVLAVEPARMDNPLLKEENCLVTPHIAWAPKESRQRLMDIAVENLKAFFGGRAAECGECLNRRHHKKSGNPPVAGSRFLPICWNCRGFLFCASTWRRKSA